MRTWTAIEFGQIAALAATGAVTAMEALGSSPVSTFPQDLTKLNTAQDDKGRF